MRAALILVVLAACGDNLHRDEIYEAVSGSRLKLEQYAFDDGTWQVEPGAFFDTQHRMRCVPQLWIDGLVRCAPIADDAIYIDDACELVIGYATTIEKPKHFVGHDTVAGVRWPSRVYRAAATNADPVSQYYERRDGECEGPFPTPISGVYFDLSAEIRASELVVITDSELGGERLGLGVRETLDGVRVPLGLVDRELGGQCRTVDRIDGPAVCEPIDAAATTLFGDFACREPVIALANGSAIPAVARTLDDAGCATYRSVGIELVPVLYRKDGDACTRVMIDPSPRVFALGAPIELPIVERTTDETGASRLQRITVEAGELRFVDDALYDTATRGECRRATFPDGSARCLPSPMARVTTRYANGCMVPIRVVEQPERSCERPAFAIEAAFDTMNVHAIGDRIDETIYRFDGAGLCSPVIVPIGITVRALGPALPPETFVGAVTFGER